MAFQTGSQLRPELSAVNYTPFLQAAGQSAQMQAQGISQLAAGAAKGFESYVQNKEREKQAAGIIKAADTMSSGFEPILEKVDPRIATALQDLRSRISDPGLSTLERASAAKAFMESAPNLLNAGVKYLDTQLNAGVKYLDTQLVTQARASEIATKAADKLNKEKIAAAARNYAIGKPADQDLTPDQQNEAFVLGMGMREKGQMTERVDKVVDGKVVPYNVTTNLLTGEVKQSQIREPYMSGAEQLQIKSTEKLMDIGADEYKKLGTDAESASVQADLADQINYALEQGAVTGPFAEASATVKNLAESLLGGNYNAAIQKLYTQGVRALSNQQIRALAKGLGSMSNDDRTAFEKSFVNIKDPKEAVRYYAEVAKLNKERADARRSFADKLIADGKTLDVVYSELFKLKKEEPFISSIARQNIFGSQPITATTAVPQAPAAVGGNVLEKLRAEQERRKAANK